MQDYSPAQATHYAYPGQTDASAAATHYAYPGQTEPSGQTDASAAATHNDYAYPPGQTDYYSKEKVFRLPVLIYLQLTYYNTKKSAQDKL
jgi:hypothetical protein